MRSRRLKAAAILLCAGMLLPALRLSAAEKEKTMIEAGKDYSFMNCDTGRVIRAGDTEYFRLEAADGGYYLTDSAGCYFRIDSGSLRQSEIKQKLIITGHQRGRFTISTADGKYITDDDSGESSAAALKTAGQAKYIEAYWYLTAKGEPAPLKIMPLGDSLTNGENADIPAEERCGYRKLLSSLIAENAPELRFVFVGSQKSGGTAYGNSAALFRHEGHNGYVINDIYGKAPPHYGIAQNIDPWLKKYQPDAVFIMLGTNDIGLSFESGDLSMIDRISENWELLAKTVLKALPDGGMLIAGAVPPIRNGEIFNAWAKRLNSNLIKLSKSLDSDRKEVVFADINTAVNENGLADSFCSDGGHFNEAGYTAVGNAFYKAFASSATYDRMTASGTPESSENSTENDTSETTEPKKNGSALRIALGAVGAAAVIGIVISCVRKKKR